jgi:endonuclease/exonuclease/phosphatase family metal-dependent hydrolase
VSPTVIRVATWNVHGLRAGAEAVAGVVRHEAVDVLLLQESGPRRRLQALGAALGMVVCHDPPAFPRRRIQNAVLARPPRDVRSHRLVRFDGGSLVHPRGALIAHLDDVTAVSLHLGLEGAERGRHVEQLLEILRRIDEPVVVGGDLNAHPGDAVSATIAAILPDVWARAGEGHGQDHGLDHGQDHGQDQGMTFPSSVPTARIDYLFTGRAFRPLRVWTSGGTVSDHLMVIADLQVGV